MADEPDMEFLMLLANVIVICLQLNFASYNTMMTSYRRQIAVLRSLVLSGPFVQQGSSLIDPVLLQEETETKQDAYHAFTRGTWGTWKERYRSILTRRIDCRCL